MTARWSDPHRLPGSPACRDLGYVRAVNSLGPAMSGVELVLAFLSGVVTGVPTSVRAKGFRSKPDDNKATQRPAVGGPRTLTRPGAHQVLGERCVHGGNPAGQPR